MRKLTVPLILTLFLSGCGHHLSGTYVGQDGGEYAGMTLDFTSDSDVQVDAGGGSVTPGTYTLQGQQVTLIDGGNTMVLAIDSDGCLDGGASVGKFCKQ
jgi:uncharacterized protein YceK